MNVEITLVQHPTNYDHYIVDTLMNCIHPTIGSVLTTCEVGQLIDNPVITVILKRDIG